MPLTEKLKSPSAENRFDRVGRRTGVGKSHTREVCMGFSIAGLDFCVRCPTSGTDLAVNRHARVGSDK